MTKPGNPLRELSASGQSVWSDNIHRSLLVSGGLAAMIERDDLRGITSNPAIFDKAISAGQDYDAQIATRGGAPRPPCSPAARVPRRASCSSTWRSRTSATPPTRCGRSTIAPTPSTAW